jgi:hypothetical protein
LAGIPAEQFPVLILRFTVGPTTSVASRRSLDPTRVLR